jgi:hypothetical protein
MRGVVPEALASRKVANREVYTEGSETAKSGTDEQKRNMRHNSSGKQSLHCKAQRTPIEQLCRFRSDWMKEEALTRGGLGIDSVSMRQEVSRSHSSYRQRAAIEMLEDSQK